jgi:hypothetical protein
MSPKTGLNWRNPALIISEEPSALFDIVRPDDNVPSFYPARERYRAAALVYPFLLRQSEPQIAFIADQVSAFTPVTLFMFVTGKAGIEISGELAGAVGPYEKVYLPPRSLVSIEVDFSVADITYRNSYFAFFGFDNRMLCWKFTASMNIERKTYEKQRE